MKTYVLIQHNTGHLNAWRDYGNAWGAPTYTVLGYFTGTHREAMKAVKFLAQYEFARGMSPYLGQ